MATVKLSQPVTMPDGRTVILGDAIAAGELELSTGQEWLRKDKWHTCSECPHTKTVYRAMIPGTSKYWPIGKLAYQSRMKQEIAL